MKFSEKTVEKNYVFNGKILDLKVDTVELINGEKAQREIVEHSGGSCVLVRRNGKILLVKQFRYAINKAIYEIPAGKLNKGENPLTTAIRELEEECGYKAKEVNLLFKVYPSPGYTSEIIYVYEAKGLTKTKVHLDKDEFLTSKWISQEKVKQMIEKGQINDAKTLIALLKAIY